MRIEAKTFAAWELTLDEGTGKTIALDSKLYFDDLLLDLQQKLNDEGSHDYSVDESGGVVTISADATFGIHWDDFALAEALGFDSNLNGSDSYESPNHADMVYYADHVQTPNLPPWKGFPESDMAASVSPTGHVHAMQGVKRYISRMRFRYIPVRRTWKANEEKTGESFERFWENWILGEKHGGRPAGPIRVEGSLEYKAPQPAEFRPEQAADQWTGLWHFELPRLVHVP